MTRRTALVLSTLGLSLAGALGLYWWHGHRPASSHPERNDPRLNYAGPFRNVNPAVHYVADQRCAECHADKARSFARHSMGRSLLPVAQAEMPPITAAQHNPFEAFGSLFTIDRDGQKVRHRRTQLASTGQPAAELVWDVHYTVGSGSHGHSYLTDRAGFVFQTPISWYTQKPAWDLAPGFGPPILTGRAIVPECLFCHANHVSPVEGTVNRYHEPLFDGHAIGCQRCHGPGELHVARRERPEPGDDRMDDSIVNPRHLDRPLREAVCEQCHLEGETRIVRRGRGLNDFRPGLPLEQFWSAFLRADRGAEGQRAVGHVEQMYQSRCFQGSAGRNSLGCVSCHDPHERVEPAERTAYFRGRCLQCHQQKPCSLPPDERLRQSAEDSCIQCHMPRYGSSDIPHTASTDHRIPRRREDAGKPKQDNAPGARPAQSTVRPADVLVSFYRDRPGLDSAEEERDLVLAVVKLALNGDNSALRALPRALPGLEAACKRAPDDLVVGEARGHALGLLGRSADALAAFEAVLSQAPERELALAGAAAMAESLGRTEPALNYWRRAVAVNPWSVDYCHRLVGLLARTERWSEAQPLCDTWIRLDPMNVEARTIRITALLAAGDREEARREFARVEALAPPDLADLHRRFDKKLR